ncbi:DUF2496 domain-containing protein [Psychrosphaera sp. 1_MG-2023]|uniref:DUF2496 domain-containing protein n=1 Tax=Psychrosphaera sp. 1_MG-2023 TaxID=3062643 RepID=UPI0026E3A43B|nr:DUF2496 domain-containing protein [Psychrosphaera sp. 1_MG-2023]MDO6718734.1 DUF2496 domain-containing protein [Psychrosphaera sp. 1_MG-2023]
MLEEQLEQQVKSDALADAPEHVKLAVDLIFLLENNKVDIDVALLAIELVKSDLQQKVIQK